MGGKQAIEPGCRARTGRSPKLRLLAAGIGGDSFYKLTLLPLTAHQIAICQTVEKTIAGSKDSLVLEGGCLQPGDNLLVGGRRR